MYPAYDRKHVESVLSRAGVPKERRDAMLAQIHFPVDLERLQAFLAPLGLTHDDLVNRMGGSP